MSLCGGRLKHKEANSALVIAILYVYKSAFADLLAEYPEVTDYAPL
jgi:hypothetical protein